MKLAGHLQHETAMCTACKSGQNQILWQSCRAMHGVLQALVRVAGRALLHNLLQLGPLILPLGEQLRYLASMMACRMSKAEGPLYRPSFDRAADHFCIHTGEPAHSDQPSSSETAAFTGAQDIQAGS